MTKNMFKHQNQTTHINLNPYLCYSIGYNMGVTVWNWSEKVTTRMSRTCHTEPVKIHDILCCIWHAQRWLRLSDVTPGNGAPLKGSISTYFLTL